MKALDALRNYTSIESSANLLSVEGVMKNFGQWIKTKTRNFQTTNERTARDGWKKVEFDGSRVVAHR